MSPDRIASVIKIATESGIPAELFSGWQGYEFALYQDTGGRGGTLEIAQRQSDEKAARGDWTLDLGNRAVGIPRDQGVAFRQRLEEAGIQFATGSQGAAYVKRIHQVSTANVDIIRELAKH